MKYNSEKRNRSDKKLQKYTQEKMWLYAFNIQYFRTVKHKSYIYLQNFIKRNNSLKNDKMPLKISKTIPCFPI